MSAAAARQMRWTEEEYLAFENNSLTRHELYGDEVYAMAGAKGPHNFIAVRVTSALTALVSGRGCEVFNSDQRIRVAATGLKYTYSDGGVVGGEPRYATLDHEEMSLVNPLLLVEVLSSSTQDYDRGEKLRHYKRIESLREVLHVWTDRRLIEQHVRDGAGWRQIDHAEGSFEVLGGVLTVEALYGTLVQ